MIYVSDVQKAAAAYAQDLKENSAEYGFGSGSPRKVRCMSCMPVPNSAFQQCAGYPSLPHRTRRNVSTGSQLLCLHKTCCSTCLSNIIGRCQSNHWLLHDVSSSP